MIVDPSFHVGIQEKYRARRGLSWHLPHLVFLRRLVFPWFRPHPGVVRVNHHISSLSVLLSSTHVHGRSSRTTSFTFAQMIFDRGSVPRSASSPLQRRGAEPSLGVIAAAGTRTRTPRSAAGGGAQNVPAEIPVYRSLTFTKTPPSRLSETTGPPSRPSSPVYPSLTLPEAVPGRVEPSRPGNREEHAMSETVVYRRDINTVIREVRSLSREIRNATGNRHGGDESRRDEMSPGALDIGRISDRVIQLMDRRMKNERERRVSL